MRIATIAVLAGGTVLLHAQQPATDPAAGNALAKMDAAYQTLPALHIKVQWSAKYSGDMSEEDFPLPGPNTLELKMQRPNKLFLSSSSKHFGKQSSYLIVCDGTTLSYWQKLDQFVPADRSACDIGGYRATAAERPRLLR